MRYNDNQESYLEKDSIRKYERKPRRRTSSLFELLCHLNGTYG